MEEKYQGIKVLHISKDEFEHCSIHEILSDIYTDDDHFTTDVKILEQYEDSYYVEYKRVNLANTSESTPKSYIILKEF